LANRYATHPGGSQFLFIRQKNVSVLMNLLHWVIWAAPHRDQKTGRPIVTGIPLLVIDDEADFASIDTKAIPIDENGNLDPEHDPTKINKLGSGNRGAETGTRLVLTAICCPGS